jgi:hypothetical protein
MKIKIFAPTSDYGNYENAGRNGRTKHLKQVGITAVKMCFL